MNQKFSCLIKSFDWNNNPTEFSYKLSENDKIKIATIKSVKEFGVDNDSKFIRVKVNIDRSSPIIDKLSNNRNPDYKEEELFLKVLLEGRTNLYQYIDNSLTRFFYNKEDQSIEQLVYKSYKTVENKISENNHFRQQLLVNLTCDNINIKKIKKLDYHKNDLIRIFKEYSACHKVDLIYLEPIQKRDFFNLTLRPRFNSSSLTIRNENFNSKDIIEFDNKIGFGFGLEAEVILPFNKNKWSFVVEPTYQNFKSEKTIYNVSTIFGGELTAKIDYISIEIPVGLRHYFLLNDYSKIFINVSYVFDLSSKSKLETKTSATSDFSVTELKTVGNLAFGMGYKFYDKYSLEARYQSNREVLKDVSPWNSDYKTFSIILGYSLL
ncbi:hypothetical protein GCM10008083_32980 [Ulvibacter litoralis]|nr:hypothetical protein GCM10008083_32980 [Ulvibacter litoralis]